jgi:hypothetical protein
MSPGHVVATHAGPWCKPWVRGATTIRNAPAGRSLRQPPLRRRNISIRASHMPSRSHRPAFKFRSGLERPAQTSNASARKLNGLGREPNRSIARAYRASSTSHTLSPSRSCCSEPPPFSLTHCRAALIPLAISRVREFDFVLVKDAATFPRAVLTSSKDFKGASLRCNVGGGTVPRRYTSLAVA